MYPSYECRARNRQVLEEVYSENRCKASQSHASLYQFSSCNRLPLYNQPSETEVYNNNKKEYTVFKKKLVEYLRKKNAAPPAAAAADEVWAPDSSMNVVSVQGPVPTVDSAESAETVEAVTRPADPPAVPPVGMAATPPPVSAAAQQVDPLLRELSEQHTRRRVSRANRCVRCENSCRRLGCRFCSYRERQQLLQLRWQRRRRQQRRCWQRRWQRPAVLTTSKASAAL